MVRACRSRHPNRHVEFLRADLAAFGEVRKAADTIVRLWPRVDVLVNNAGARNDTHEETPDGIERTFAANHLGHHLLTSLLRPHLERARPGRVITVASSVHASADLTDGWIANRARYDRRVAYANSKLANVVFARELASRVDPGLLVSNSVDPGLVATGFARNNGISRWLKHLVAHALRRELISAARGADTVVYLAVSERGGQLSGCYLREREPVNPSALADDPEVRAALWDVSDRLVGLTR